MVKIDHLFLFSCPLRRSDLRGMIFTMNRKIPFSPGNYYHIYNRGVEKRKIFTEENDYWRFLLLLFLCNDSGSVDIREHFREGRTFADLWRKVRGNTLVDIGAYCLMPNHFHLLLKAKSDFGVTAFMRKLGTAYAMYFNKKSKRSGALFQGKFGAQILDDDVYLKYIFAYIHLNPVKLIEPDWKERGIKNIDRAKKFLDGYRWSSYRIYIGKKSKDRVLNRSVFPKYFSDRNEFRDFLDDWLYFAKVRPSQEEYD